MAKQSLLRQSIKLKRWVPTEKQVIASEILANPSLTRFLFDGGARCGKTVAITRWFVNRALEFPGSKQFVGRFRQKDARFSVWLTFKEYLYDYVPRSYCKFQNKDLEIHFMNGSVIHFDGLDSKERVDFILGTEWLTMFINEATQVTYDTLTTIMTRLSQKVCHSKYSDIYGLPKVIIDCNPKHSKHWIYQFVIRNPPVQPDSDPPIILPKAARWHRLHWTPFDNARNLPNSYFATLDNLPAVKRARMRDGVWKDNDGMVYDEFDEDIHVIEPFGIPPDWKHYRAIDFGYANPFVCLWAAVDHDGCVYIYDEHYMREMVVSEHAKIIRERSQGIKFDWTVADWDAEDRATLHYEGIKTVNADKRISRGIELVKKRLIVQGNGKPRLFIFKGRCPNIVGEFYDWIWDPLSPYNREKKEKPIKNSDHCMDTLRYLIMRIDSGGVSSRIESIRTQSERDALFEGF